MGTTFSKIKLKDGSIRFVKDATARQNIADIQNEIADINSYIEEQPTGITVLPVPSVSEVDHIYQYLGESTGDLYTGDFYTCVYDGKTGAYKWKALTYNSEEIDQKIQDIYDNTPTDQEIEDLFVTN